MSRPIRPISERFWSMVKKMPSGCLEWQFAKSIDGYGKMRIQRDGRWRMISPHRLAWMLFRGPIPVDLVVDHLCNNPACCNVDHLRVCTQRENVLRSRGVTAELARRRRCHRGHPLQGDNLRIGTRGQRICRECQRMRDKVWRDANPELHRVRNLSWSRRNRDKINARRRELVLQCTEI